MYKYPTWKLSATRAQALRTMTNETAAALIGLLHNMVLSAEDPTQDPPHRKWCAGQAAVISAYLLAKFPRGEVK